MLPTCSSPADRCCIPPAPSPQQKTKRSSPGSWNSARTSPSFPWKTTKAFPAEIQPVKKYIGEFFNEIDLKSLGGQPFDWNRVEVRADKVYYLPPVSCSFRGLTFLRNGLYLGDLKKNRFEPSQPLALAFRKDEVEAIISLPVDDPRLERYLKGETLTILPEEAVHTKGWHLLCVEGYPLGFGKLVNGTLKNKYPAGWRA